MIASSIVGPTNTLGMIGAALVGGLAGALILVFAYFVGDRAGRRRARRAGRRTPSWTQFGSGDPPALLIVGAAVAGAIGAMFLQRYVIIVGTAFGGAWTIVVGLMSIIGGRSGNANVWILYPTMPAGVEVDAAGLGRARHRAAQPFNWQSRREEEVGRTFRSAVVKSEI